MLLGHFIVQRPLERDKIGDMPHVPRILLSGMLSGARLEQQALEWQAKFFSVQLVTSDSSLAHNVQGIVLALWTKVCTRVLPSLPLTWQLREGPFKRKPIFQVPPHRCHVTWKGKIPSGFFGRGHADARLMRGWCLSEIGEVEAAFEDSSRLETRGEARFPLGS